MDSTGFHQASGLLCLYFQETSLRNHSNTDGRHTIHAAPPTTMSHLRELLKGQLEAACVVGGPLGRDVLHGLLQHPLVAHVGLHQVLEAGGVRGRGVELERGQKEGGRGRVGKWRGGTCTYFFWIKYVARFETESCRVLLQCSSQPIPFEIKSNQINRNAHKTSPHISFKTKRTKPNKTTVLIFFGLCCCKNLRHV